MKQRNKYRTVWGPHVKAQINSKNQNQFYVHQ